MRGLRTATSFLTRVPVRPGTLESADLDRAVPWFPVVGALVGLGVAGIYAAGRWALPPFVASAIAIGFGVLATGALHEDGLADTVDAVGGGRTRREALEILRDPAHGTYGVLALCLDLLLRIGALASLDRWSAVAVLTAANALGRAASVGLLAFARPAVADGLGASYAEAVSVEGVRAAVGVGLAIGLAMLGPWLPIAALPAAAGVAMIGGLSIRKLGGVTGDVLGAAEQAVEIVVLLVGAALVARGVPPAWWR